VCGRFTLTAPADVLADELGLAAAPTGLLPRYNIAPTQPVPVVTAWQRSAITLMRWGLIPSWADDPAVGSRLINARAETLADRPSFREAYQRRRCLVVADGFYEWNKGPTRTPMYIRRRSRRPFAFAGLWDGWLAPTGALVRSCTIITTRPNELVAPIHDRMPVILDREARAAWLDEDADLAHLHGLLCACPADTLEAYAVSTLVSSPANDRPECIRPELPGGTLPLFPD
jgi:putative SOS response-associated peptidase YedK